jgi:integrase
VANCGHFEGVDESTSIGMMPTSLCGGIPSKITDIMDQQIQYTRRFNPMAIKWNELTKTRYPGVRKRPADGALVIRVKQVDPRKGKKVELFEVLQHQDVQQAVAERAGLVRQLKDGTYGNNVGPKVTLSTYAQRWIVQKKNEGLRTRSLEHNVNVLTKFVLPFLGDVYVNTLTPMDIRRWQNEVASLKKPDGTKYSQWTMAGWVAMLRNIVRDAVVEFGLRINPCMGLKKVGKPKSPRANRHLTLPQLRQFLKLVERWFPDHYGITLLLATYGLRWGEASALHIEHIDEEAMELKVVQSHTRGQVTRTKTDSYKYLPLDDGVLLVLKDYISWVKASKRGGADNQRLFPGRNGGYRLPGSCSKAWTKVCAAMGLGWTVTAHDLRRTFQNMLRQAGVGLTVQQALMGHSSIQMTEHYSSVNGDEKREAVAKVVSLMAYKEVKEETA